MTAREKIEAARAATSTCEGHITTAFQRIGIRQMDGMEGVYASPVHVALSITVAIDELKKALRAIEGAPRVTEADLAARDSEVAGEE